MRIRAVLGSILGSVTVLVVGWQAGAAAAHNAESAAASSASTTTPGSSASTGTGSPATPTASATASPTPSASAASTAVSGTFAGSTIDTQYGPMQVEVVVVSGKITNVKALQLTNQGGRSVEISNEAAPILRKEALAAQSAKIATVGGATYTSEGYISSLQSALDKAGL